MSEMSWCRKYFNVAPESAAARGAVAAAKHSLRKWRGALPSALKKHKLTTVPIYFDSDSCALCHRFLFGACLGCPLHAVLGHRCDHGWDSPYQKWIGGDAKPMIRALERALAHARKHRR
jgi:ferredoxin